MPGRTVFHLMLTLFVLAGVVAGCSSPPESDSITRGGSMADGRIAPPVVAPSVDELIEALGVEAAYEEQVRSVLEASQGERNEILERARESRDVSGLEDDLQDLIERTAGMLADKLDEAQLARYESIMNEALEQGLEELERMKSQRQGRPGGGRPEGGRPGGFGLG